MRLHGPIPGRDQDPRRAAERLHVSQAGLLNAFPALHIILDNDGIRGRGEVNERQLALRRSCLGYARRRTKMSETLTDEAKLAPRTTALLSDVREAAIGSSVLTLTPGDAKARSCPLATTLPTAAPASWIFVMSKPLTTALA